MIPLLNSSGRRYFVLRRISDGTVINNRALWPNADESAPIAGLDPDLQYLPVLTQSEPDYDPRLFVLVRAEAKVASEWHITFATQARPLPDAKINALNVEAAENQRHYREQERDKLVLLGLGVLFRQVANQQLTVKEQALKSRIIYVATRLWKNDTRLSNIIAALEAGQTPDLDTGWEPTA